MSLVVRCARDPDNRLIVGTDSKGTYIQTRGYDEGPPIYLTRAKAESICAAVAALGEDCK